MGLPRKRKKLADLSLEFCDAGVSFRQPVEPRAKRQSKATENKLTTRDCPPSIQSLPTCLVDYFRPRRTRSVFPLKHWQLFAPGIS